MNDRASTWNVQPNIPAIRPAKAEQARIADDQHPLAGYRAVNSPLSKAFANAADRISSRAHQGAEVSPDRAPDLSSKFSPNRSIESLDGDTCGKPSQRSDDDRLDSRILRADVPEQPRSEVDAASNREVWNAE